MKNMFLKAVIFGIFTGFGGLNARFDFEVDEQIESLLKESNVDESSCAENFKRCLENGKCAEGLVVVAAEQASKLEVFTFQAIDQGQAGFIKERAKYYRNLVADPNISVNRKKELFEGLHGLIYQPWEVKLNPDYVSDVVVPWIVAIDKYTKNFFAQNPEGVELPEKQN